jgi:hypothetical protein
MPNFRKYARGRPQIWQRLYARTANFGFFFQLSILDFFATVEYSRFSQTNMAREQFLLPLTLA